MERNALMHTLLATILRMAAGLALIFPSLGCTPARLLNAVTPKDGYRIEQGVAYGDEQRQRLDVYIPDGSLQSAKVVVFFYGGRWAFGARGDYAFIGQALADQGVIAIIADYRLHPEVGYPSFIEDGALAIKWTKDNVPNYGGDPHQIFLMGHSAGAYIAAMLALDRTYLAEVNIAPDDLAGMIGLAGPYDFLPIKDPMIKEIFKAQDLQETQPIHHATGKAPPMLLLTGANDETVLPRNSRALAETIEQRGGDVTLKIYNRVAHVGVILSIAYPFRWLAPILKDVAEFLEQTKTTKRRAA